MGVVFGFVAFFSGAGFIVYAFLDSLRHVFVNIHAEHIGNGTSWHVKSSGGYSTGPLLDQPTPTSEDQIVSIMVFDCSF